MFRMSILVVGATIIALSAGMLVSRLGTAEAGKPQLVIGDVILENQGSCMATISWSGLPGGRTLNINVSLNKVGGGSTGFEAFSVRQDDGQLIINYGGMTNVQGINVTFQDNRFNLLVTQTFAGSC